MKHTYGPVPSRRLGVSLGVDLVPKKICSYDCIYCQIGATTLRTIERQEYIHAHSILDDVDQALREWGDRVDHISISGSGEPTLNSKINEIIQGIKELTPIPVAVITNGSLLFRAEVRKDLCAADVIIPSLDAVTPHVFHTVNRPHPSLKITEIIQGLTDLRAEYAGQIWLEILLCRGLNDVSGEIEALRDTIRAIRLDKVQLNTVVRPAAEDYAFALTPRQLERAHKVLGDDVEIIADFEGRRGAIAWSDVEEKIIRLIQSRPVTPDDLSKTLGLHDLEITKILNKLTKEGKVKYRVFNQRLYYEVDKGEVDTRA